MSRNEELILRFLRDASAKSVGAKLTLLQEGLAVVRAQVKEEFLVEEGMMNGGLIATYANTAGVYAAMSAMLAGHARAINPNVICVNPVRAGEELVATARVKHQSRALMVVEIEVKAAGRGDAPEALKALALIVYYLPPKTK